AASRSPRPAAPSAGDHQGRVKAYERLRGPCGSPQPSQGRDAPHGLREPERETADEEAVHARTRTGDGEDTDECPVAGLERIREHHRGDGAAPRTFIRVA